MKHSTLVNEPRLTCKIVGSYTRVFTVFAFLMFPGKKRNKELYGKLPRVSETIQITRLRFIDQCWRRTDETIFNLTYYFGNLHTERDPEDAPVKRMWIS